MNISAEQHVHVLAGAQRNVDNSVSKTCNGAVNDTVESVDALYRLARQLGCKAVSYYRDGSRDNQVLTSMKAEEKKEPVAEIVDAPPATHADAAHLKAIDPEAEGLARAEAGAVIREQADAEAEESARLMSSSGISAPELTAIRIERPRQRERLPGRFPFDGQNLYVTVTDEAHDTGGICDGADQRWRGRLLQRCCAVVSTQRK